MNNIQKALLIVGVITLIFWLFSTFGTYYLYEFFEYSEAWFVKWYQIAAFALSIGCFFGAWLLKDNK